MHQRQREQRAQRAGCGAAGKRSVHAGCIMQLERAGLAHQCQHTAVKLRQFRSSARREGLPDCAIGCCQHQLRTIRVRQLNCALQDGRKCFL